MEGPRFFWSPRGARATRVVLIGLSGSGKSTVATLLAQRLRRSCVDLDREIERRAGRSVALLFEEGEGAFRELESRALQDSLEGTRSLVLACGAGVLERSENRELLTTRAKVVWLAVDPETAVIGGLIRSNESTLKRGIPVLMDIPLLGNLFRSSSATKQKRELLIFVTPKILGETASRE